jgi:hypothetical protein
MATTNGTTGREMAKAIYGDLLALGASEDQAKRAVLRAFARLALVLPGGLSAETEERSLSIASGEEF